jgi:ribose 5-phosphate isomerase A
MDRRVVLTANQLDKLKRDAAEAAIDLVRPGMVIGLGTGSTAAHFLQLLGERIRSGRLHDVRGVPTSEGAAAQAQKHGIPLTTLETDPDLALTVDGADEVDPELNVIKGGGNALLREKIVAQASHMLIIIVDETKLSNRLGETWPVPIEVIPFGWKTQASFLEDQGALVELRMAESGAPLHTDQGNYILHCRFGPIADPHRLAHILDARAGIVEHGLFLGMANEVIVAGQEGIRRLLSSS